MGKLVSKLGLGNIFKFGIFLSSLCALGFGFLTYVDDTLMFLLLAYLLRLLEGIGGAALWTSMLALLLAR